MLEDGRLEGWLLGEADFLDDFGEGGVQLLDVLDDSIVVSVER